MLLSSWSLALVAFALTITIIVLIKHRAKKKPIKIVYRKWIPAVTSAFFAAAVAIVCFLFADWQLALMLSACVLFWSGMLYGEALLIPTVHKGVLLRLNERIYDAHDKLVAFDEGLCFIIPFLEQVNLFELTLQTLHFAPDEKGESTGKKGGYFTFESADKLEIKMKGYVQYRPDDLNTFLQMDEETVQHGIQGAIKDEIGAMGGACGGTAFITKREAVRVLANELMRLKEPWYVAKKLRMSEAFDDSRVRGKPKVPNNYIDNIQEIRKILAHEQNLPDKSEIEERYGVDIVTVVVEDIDYTDKTKLDFEKKVQAEAQASANEVFAKNLKFIIDRLPPGLDDESKVNTAMNILGKIDRRVLAFEGTADGLIAAVMTAFASAKLPPGGAPPASIPAPRPKGKKGKGPPPAGGAPLASAGGAPPAPGTGGPS